MILGDFRVFFVFSPFHFLFPAQVKDPLLVSLHFSAISWPCFGTVHVGPGLSWVVLPGSVARRCSPWGRDYEIWTSRRRSLWQHLLSIHMVKFMVI